MAAFRSGLFRRRLIYDPSPRSAASARTGAKIVALIVSGKTLTSLASARTGAKTVAGGRHKVKIKAYAVQRDTHPKTLDLEVSRGIFISPLKNHRKNEKSRNVKAAAWPALRHGVRRKKLPRLPKETGPETTWKQTRKGALLLDEQRAM
jgi:hypothetical protein